MSTSYLLVIALLIHVAAVGATTATLKAAAPGWPTRIPAHKRNLTGRLLTPNEMGAYEYCNDWSCCGKPRTSVYAATVDACSDECDNDNGPDHGCSVFTWDYVSKSCKTYTEYCNKARTASTEGSNTTRMYSYSLDEENPPYVCPTVVTNSTCPATNTTADPCNPSPCKNGGICTPSSWDPSTAVCSCNSSDWYGTFCDIPNRFTDLQRCRNTRSCCEKPLVTLTDVWIYDCEQECRSNPDPGDGSGGCVAIEWSAANRTCKMWYECTRLKPGKPSASEGRFGAIEPSYCQLPKSCKVKSKISTSNAKCRRSQYVALKARLLRSDNNKAVGGGKKVEIFVNGTRVGSSNTNGQGWATVRYKCPGLTGWRNIVGKFGGDGNFLSSQGGGGRLQITK